MIDKSRLVDSMGRPLTQSLFLEIGYSDYAIYTLKEHDYAYKGTNYPSLKRLYLKEEDPTEWSFADKYLLGWQHWKRLCENKVIAKHVEEWREELALKLRSQGVREMLNLCASEQGNFSAAKYLANKEWEKRAPGRPSKAEKERALRQDEKLFDEYSADIKRLDDFRK